MGIRRDVPQLRVVSLDLPPARELERRQQAEMVSRYGGGGGPHPLDSRTFEPPEGCFVLAEIRGTPVACGGFRRAEPAVAELKLVRVEPAFRRRGIGRLLLSFLESEARRVGYGALVLETGDGQPEAIALYESSGYCPCPSLGEYRGLPGVRAFKKGLASMPPSPNQPLVRDARPEDSSEVLALLAQLAEDRRDALPAGGAAAAGIMRQIELDPDRSLLVAEVGGRVVGTADLTVRANLTHGGRAWAILENLVVDSSWRRKGTGRALLTEVRRRCEDANCYKIQLLSRTHRTEAHDFYETMGYEMMAGGFRSYLT